MSTPASPSTAYATQTNSANRGGVLNIALTCGILNAYRDINLVTPQDGQLYTVQAHSIGKFFAHRNNANTALMSHPLHGDIPTASSSLPPLVQFFVGLLGITGTTYAIRSGGHSPFKGFASTDRVVLLSMHKMKGVGYDAQSDTVRLAMGNNWGEVYGNLTLYNRIVVGGRVPDVGMALVTGGIFRPSHYPGLCISTIS